MSLEQGNNFRDVVRFEDDSAGRLSREKVTVLSGQNLSVGAVLGKGTLALCPTSGTSGSTPAIGTCKNVTAGAKAKVGTYKLTCIHKETNLGLFSVRDPDGEGLPTAYVGQVYVNDQINFLIEDTSPDYDLGNSFTITIGAGDGKVKKIAIGAATSVLGDQDAYGILTADCDATGGDVDAVAIVKDAVIIAANLVWPTGSPLPSEGEKAIALAQLAAKGIVARKEA